MLRPAIVSALKIALWIATMCIIYALRTAHSHLSYVLVFSAVVGGFFMLKMFCLWLVRHMITAILSLIPLMIGLILGFFSDIWAEVMWQLRTPPPPYFGPGTTPWQLFVRVPKPFMASLPALPPLTTGNVCIAIVAVWSSVRFVQCLMAVCSYIWQRIPSIKKQTRSMYEELSEFHADCKQKFNVEKLLPGNVLTNGTQPRFQCDVEVKYPGMGFHYAGQAFRVDNYLYTAHHVVAETKGVRFSTEHGTVEIPYPEERIVEVEGDIARVLLTPAELGNLQMKSARFSEVVSGKVIATCFGNGLRSTGFVSPFDAFGYVEYNGSTLPGHSGAPYLVGKAVVGMHLGGQVANIGYDGQYLRMLHKKVQEDSDDYLMQLCGKGFVKDALYRQSPYDPDDYQVKVNGKYFNVDRSTISDMRKSGVTLKNYAGEIEYEEEMIRYDAVKPTVTIEFDDSRPKNVEAPAVDAGASGSSSITPREAAQNLSSPISEGIPESRGPKSQLSALLSLMLAQLKDRSDCTQPESTELKGWAELNALNLMKDTKQAIRLYLDFVNGVSQLEGGALKTSLMPSLAAGLETST
nr:hypothetical protein [Luteoviridae sp.]